MSVTRQVVIVFCLLALAAYVAVVATGEVRELCPAFEHGCATPASIEGGE